MLKYLVSVYKGEDPKLCASELELKKGDMVVVRDEICSEVGAVEQLSGNNEIQPDFTVVRIATERDIETFHSNEEKKQEIVTTSKEEIHRLGLAMKLIDVRISLDGSNVFVLFTADERIDFRELVKNLSQIFHRSIRMHQIGSRDEARKVGGCGVCGRGLCCLKFAGNLPSISIDMARVQQVAHRGSERISGICGRLMCCLSYEAGQYKEMLAGMPELHSSVKTKDGKGEVIELNAITQEVKVRFPEGKIGTYKKEDLEGATKQK